MAKRKDPTTLSDLRQDGYCFLCAAAEHFMLQYFRSFLVRGNLVWQ